MDDVVSNILSLNHINRLKKLQNLDIKKQIFELPNHYAFKELIENLRDEELKLFFDDDAIKLLIDDQNIADKINSIIRLGSNMKNTILDHQEIIKMMVDNNSLSYLIGNLSGDINYHILCYIIEHKREELLLCFNEKELINLLKNHNVLDLIIKSKNLGTSIIYFPIVTINNLLYENYYQNIFLDLSIDNISKLLLRGLKVPNDIISDLRFQDKYLGIEDCDTYRLYVNILLQNNYDAYITIDAKRKMTYDKRMRDFNGHMFKDYDDLIQRANNQPLYTFVNDVIFLFKLLKYQNDLPSFLAYFTKKQLTPMLIDRYFGDCSFNVLCNLKSIIDFNKSLPHNIVPRKRLNLYEKILSFSSFDVKTQKQIYKSIPHNMESLFYDDFRSCQDYAYNLINKKISLVSSICKKENGPKIYELKGEPFFLAVHCTDISKKYYDSDVLWKDDTSEKTISISLIGDSFLGTYKNPRQIITFGFKYLNPDNILHMYHTDSFSEHERSSKRVNEIYTPENLLRKTDGYNEILLSTDNLNLKPDYLICYDDITEVDMHIANRLNIPIVIIYTSCYQKLSRKTISIKNLNYVRTVYDLPKTSLY